LPLALSLAGSYLEAKNASPWSAATPGSVTTFAAFRAALDKRFESSLFASTSTMDRDERRRRSDITTTWELSLDLLARRGVPEARLLLRLLACFGEAPICT
jgi:hypothetical protein